MSDRRPRAEPPSAATPRQGFGRLSAALRSVRTATGSRVRASSVIPGYLTTRLAARIIPRRPPGLLPTIVLPLLVFILLTIGVATFAYLGVRYADRASERLKLASTVLDSFRQLSIGLVEMQHMVGHFSGKNSSRGDLVRLSTREAVLTRQIEGSIVALRNAILAEIAFAGTEPWENEQEEFDRLTQIEPLVTAWLSDYKAYAAFRDAGRTREMRSAERELAESLLPPRIMALIKAGIDDEIDEINKARDTTGSVMLRTEYAAIVVIALTLLVGAISITALIRTVYGTIATLREGTAALARGEFDHRIAIADTNEFGDIATNLNRMTGNARRRDQERQQAHDDLEKAVVDRTQDFIDAKRELEALDSSRRRFLADVSHELRTPLTIIRGESEVALRGADKSLDEYKRALQTVREQAGQVATLVDDLLFLARRDSGQVRLKLADTMLGGLIAQVCDELRTTTTERGLTLTFTDTAPGLSVLVDPGRIRQLMLICLDNAVRYSLPDGRIDVSLSLTDEGALIRIADHGIGISAEELPSIFERYYRGARARGLDGQGVGLGLPMAKSIIEAHGGSIRIESEANEGTTALLKFPIQIRWNPPQ